MRISENVAVGCWVLAGLSVAVWFSTLVALGPAPGGSQAQYQAKDARLPQQPRSGQVTRAAAVALTD